MNDLESKFTLTIKQNKSTIYTVCYMFSRDADKVNDLFQEAVSLATLRPSNSVAVA